MTNLQELKNLKRGDMIISEKTRQQVVRDADETGVYLKHLPSDDGSENHGEWFLDFSFLKRNPTWIVKRNN